MAADLALLADLDGQIATAQARIAALVPATVYGVLTTTAGWGTLRAGTYAAAVGDPARWPSHAQLYRASGLTPAQYESAGRRRDGGISRCALARRANKIAFAMVRDQTVYDPHLLADQRVTPCPSQPRPDVRAWQARKAGSDADRCFGARRVRGDAADCGVGPCGDDDRLGHNGAGGFSRRTLERATPARRAASAA